MGKREIKGLIKGIKEYKRRAGIDKAVLFGSYARGTFKKDSDMDILFVTEDKKAASAFMREASAVLGRQVNGIAVSWKEFVQGIERRIRLSGPLPIS